VAFERAPESTEKRRGRGRPKKYGKKIKLKEVFQSRAKDFQKATVSLCGKSETIEYLCLDLLWRPVKGIIRFVLVKNGTTPFMYGYRLKVEVTFKSLKHIIESFFLSFLDSCAAKIFTKNY
jgi:hypothetical protein